MGGPVYLYFSDASGVQQTSGENQLVTETPPNWDMLYPGMNIHFEAQAVLQGHSWTHEKTSGENVIVVTTGAILRARILIEVTDPEGNTDTTYTNDLYNWIWPQLQARALADESNEGMWVFDEIDTETPENNYFYYVNKSQSHTSTGDYVLTEIGGVDYNVSVGFLNDAVITLPGVELTNDHADCRIKFTIVFHGLQAFLPYESQDIGQPYQGDTTGRSTLVTYDDVGMAKPLTIANSRRVFKEAFSSIYDETEPY